MKRELSTADFVKYIRETYGCRNIVNINYELIDKDDGEVLLAGKIPVTQEARLMVMGQHPSGNKYGSTIGAQLDIVDPAIKNFLRQRMDNKVLMATGMPVSSAKQDEQARRIKAIVWQVTHVDDETQEVWVHGVI